MRALALALLLCGCGRVDPSDALPLGDDAESCGSCHESHYDEWRTSRHAASASSPVLDALLPEVERAWGSFARTQCEGCHAPAHSSDEGIGCLSCHAAVGNHAERDGMLAVDPSVPLAGPFHDAAPTLAHRSRGDDDFLVSPSLCGTCHEVTAPGLVNEPTLTEYRASPAAAEGRTCADCHLPSSGERALSSDSDRLRPTRSHRVVGFDPPWGAPPDEAIDAAARTRELLASALTLRIEPAEGGVDVVVRNEGAGHAVPTGAAFMRDLWVDVEIDGALEPRVIALCDQPMQGDTPVALLTEADHVEHGSLAPGEERRVFMAADPGATVVATLRGRAIRDEVLAALDLTSRADEIPTHEIAISSRAP